MLPESGVRKVVALASPSRRVLAALFGRTAAGLDEAEALRNRARGQLKRAVVDGTVDKPLECQACGKRCEPHALHGHHHDYTKPLDVDWLCATCHRHAHASEPR